MIDNIIEIDSPSIYIFKLKNGNIIETFTSKPSMTQLREAYSKYLNIPTLYINVNLSLKTSIVYEL